MCLLLSPLSWRLPVGMLRKLKLGLRPLSLIILTSLPAIGGWAATDSDDVPIGYKTDRYQPVWERNPFTLVAPVVTNAQPKVFDKLVLVSWLNDAGKDVVFVQNTETNEVQKITAEENGNHFRLVAIHKAADPKNAEAVISNGAEEGAVKFRVEAAIPAQAEAAPQPAVPTAAAQNQVPGVQNQVPGAQPAPAQPIPGMPRQVQASRGLANQQGAVQMQTLPPRASEVRRKRITAPPVNEQPVGAPVPSQNNPSQPQTQ
jgi:hypothetical protein